MGDLFTEDEFWRVDLDGSAVTLGGNVFPATSSAYITNWVLSNNHGFSGHGTDKIVFGHAGTYIVEMNFFLDGSDSFNIDSRIELYDPSDNLVYSRVTDGQGVGSIGDIQDRFVIPSAGYYIKIWLSHGGPTARVFQMFSRAFIARDFTENTVVTWPTNYLDPLANLEFSELNSVLNVLPFPNKEPFAASSYYPSIKRIDDTRAFVSVMGFAGGDNLDYYDVQCFVVKREADGTLTHGPIFHLQPPLTGSHWLESERHASLVFEDGRVVLGSFQWWQEVGVDYDEGWVTYLLKVNGMNITKLDHHIYNVAEFGSSDNFPDIIQLEDNKILVFHYDVEDMEVLTLSSTAFTNSQVFPRPGFNETVFQPTKAVMLDNGLIAVSTFHSVGDTQSGRVIVPGRWTGSTFEWGTVLDFPDPFINASIFQGTEAHLVKVGSNKFFCFYGADAAYSQASQIIVGTTPSEENTVGPQQQPGGSFAVTGIMGGNNAYPVSDCMSNVWQKFYYEYSQMRIMYFEIDEDLKLSFSSPHGVDSFCHYGGYNMNMCPNPYEPEKVMVKWITNGAQDLYSMTLVAKYDPTSPTNVTIMGDGLPKAIPAWENGSWSPNTVTYLGHDEVVHCAWGGSPLIYPENWPDDCNVEYTNNYNGNTGTLDPPLTDTHEGVSIYSYNVPSEYAPPSEPGAFVKRFDGLTSQVSLFAGNQDDLGDEDGPAVSVARFTKADEIAALTGGPQRPPIIPNTNRYYVFDQNNAVRLIHPCVETITPADIPGSFAAEGLHVGPSTILRNGDWYFGGDDLDKEKHYTLDTVHLHDNKFMVIYMNDKRATSLTNNKIDVEWMVVEVDEDTLQVEARLKEDLFSNANKYTDATAITKLSETDSEIKFLWTYGDRVSSTYSIWAQVLTYFKSTETMSAGTAVSLQSGGGQFYVRANQGIWAISPTSAIVTWQSHISSPAILRRARLTISGSTITVVNVADITGSGMTFGTQFWRVEPITATLAVLTMYDQQFGETKMCTIDSSGNVSATVSLGLSGWGASTNRLIRLWDNSNTNAPVFILANVDAPDYGLSTLTYVKFAYNIGSNTISWPGNPSLIPPDEGTGSGDDTWVSGDLMPYITKPIVAQTTYGPSTTDAFLAHDGTYLHTHHFEYEPTYPSYDPYYVNGSHLMVTHTDIDGQEFLEAKDLEMIFDPYEDNPNTESYWYVDGYGRGENIHQGAVYFNDDRTIGLQVFGAFYETLDVAADDYWDLFHIEGFAFRYNKVI